MKPFDLVIFDLDGTLIDTKDDLAASVNWLRAGLGRPPVGVEQVLDWVGDGAPVLVGRAIGVAEDDIDRSDQVRDALGRFRTHYGSHMMDHARPYPGVTEGLARLQESGRTLAVVSNKPSVLCGEMLERSGIRGRFAEVLGGDSLPVRKPDRAPLDHVMGRVGIAPDRSVMVGDGPQDILAGRAAGVVTVAVLYGFRSRAILALARPDHFVGSFSELHGLI